MNNKPTYNELEKQISKLTSQNEVIRLNSKSEVSVSNNHLKFLFDNSINGYAYCQIIAENNIPSDFIYIEVNSAFEKLTRIQNATGRKASEVFPQLRKQKPEIVKVFGNVAITGIPTKFEIFLAPLKIWLTVSVICPERDYFIATFINVSESRQLEIKLKEGEERFRQLIKNSFDMIVLLDLDGNQLFVSESCEKILGYRPEELMSIPVIEQMIHPDDQEETVSGLNAIINRTGTGGAQYRHRHKNGSWVYLEAFGSNQTDNPFINSIVLNVRDITERKNFEQVLKESEARLRELIATRDKFFSIIAHDLRGPFTGFLGLSQIMAEELTSLTKDEIQDIAMSMNNSAANLFRLLENLLTWARMQQGLIPFKKEIITLHQIATESLEPLKESAKKKAISITYDIPSEIKIFADGNMLQTIFRNLVSNALKFTPKGGIVNILAKTASDKSVIISVEDSGIGMNSKMVDHLFRLDIKTSRKGTDGEPSTGLGLFLCKEFVEKHGGKLWVESKEGIGSIFYFTIPCC
ncbi:MAG TPA: PAS domain-containing sensor histidine kinase [Prolixibacteraceae bacterium]|nr:PAS domain-containing sensor histidine kinase [Prolixibacteraceae bacterium]